MEGNGAEIECIFRIFILYSGDLVMNFKTFPSERLEEIKQWYTHWCSQQKWAIPFAQMSYEQRKSYRDNMRDLLDDFPNDEKIKSFVLYAEMYLVPYSETIKHNLFSEKLQVRMSILSLIAVLTFFPGKYFPVFTKTTQRIETMQDNIF